MIDEPRVFQVQASLYKITSMSHWWRLLFDTQDDVSAEKMAVVINWMNKLGWLTFSAHQIEAEDIIDLPEIKTDDRKTPSQRLRGVLYKLWEQDHQGHETSETHYLVMMEKIINKFKEQLY